jgi:hypothetical protein
MHGIGPVVLLLPVLSSSEVGGGSVADDEVLAPVLEPSVSSDGDGSSLQAKAWATSTARR